MVTEFLFNLLFDMCRFLIALIPTPVYVALDTSGILGIIGYGVWVITPTVFLLIFSNIMFWSSTHFVFGTIKFLWRLIK